LGHGKSKASTHFAAANVVGPAPNGLVDAANAKLGVASEEVGAPKKLSLVAGHVTQPATPIGDVDLATAKARPTRIDELRSGFGWRNCSWRCDFY